MFDIGLSEILIVAIVALVVLGPERLPKAARLAGFWVRKARAQWYTVKAELESEMQDEELKESLKASMADLQQTLNSSQQDFEQEMRALDVDIKKNLVVDDPALPADMPPLDTDLQVDSENDPGADASIAPDVESKPQ